MEAATFSAIAASLAALAAWYAQFSARDRGIESWKRDTALKCGIEILQEGQRRHNLEHHFLDDNGEIAADELQRMREQLRRITEVVDTNNRTVRVLADRALVEACQRATDLHFSIDYDLADFSKENPDGGRYRGAMYCLSSGIGENDIETQIERALLTYTESRTQRTFRRVTETRTLAWDRLESARKRALSRSTTEKAESPSESEA